MTEVTLFANLLLIAVSSSSVLVAIVLNLLFRRKESLPLSLILLGVLMLTSGKVVYQFATEVLFLARPDADLGLWLREAWFVVGRALIVLFFPPFLRIVVPQPQGRRRGDRFWMAGVAWTILSLGWLAWFAFGQPSEAMGWAAWGLFGGFSILVLVGVVQFAQHCSRSSDRFLQAFGWFLVADAFLILSLTLSKNYFGFSFGGFYDLIVNGLYGGLFAAGAWYSFRVQKPLALLPNDQVEATRFERFGLSARELEIARLVVEGRSNQEIATALFIAPKTVENHLYRIYQKTGIKNRVQLYRLFRS